jgi:hypothetical protein
MFNARRFYVVCDFVLLEMIRYIFQENSKDRSSPQVSCLSCDMKRVRIFVFNLVLVVDTQHYLEDPDIDGKIILRWIFRKWVAGHGLV